MNQEEKLYVSVRPSQMVNIAHYAGAAAFTIGMVILSFALPMALGAALLGAFYAAWRYMVINAMVFEVTSERIKHRSGVFNKSVNEMELYRVRDYQVQQPFFLRLVGRGNVLVTGSDRSHHELVLWAVPDSEKVANTIRSLVEKARKARGVRDLDVGMDGQDLY